MNKNPNLLLSYFKCRQVEYRLSYYKNINQLTVQPFYKVCIQNAADLILMAS